LDEALKGNFVPLWMVGKIYVPPEHRRTCAPQAETFATDKDKIIDKSGKNAYIEDKAPRELPADLSEDERVVAERITAERKQVDQIIAESGLPANRVLATLTLLEMKGLLRRHPGKYYSLPD